jgi:hypothetical protein
VAALFRKALESPATWVKKRGGPLRYPTRQAGDAVLNGQDKEGHPSELRSRVPGVVCRGTPERTRQAGRRERAPPPVRETGRDSLQALDQGGEAPKGAEEDFEEDPDTIRSSRGNGFMLGLLGERFICPKNDLRIANRRKSKDLYVIFTRGIFITVGRPTALNSAH